MTHCVSRELIKSVFALQSGKTFLSWDDAHEYIQSVECEESDAYFGSTEIPTDAFFSKTQNPPSISIPPSGRMWYSNGKYAASRGAFEDEEFDLAELVNVSIVQSIAHAS